MDRSAEDALKEPFKRTNRTDEREKARAQKRVRVCDAPGCKEEGQHPAPKSRRKANERYYFCLEHVREYNKAWNYFEGMTPGAVERVPPPCALRGHRFSNSGRERAVAPSRHPK